MLEFNGEYPAELLDKAIIFSEPLSQIILYAA